MHDGEDKDSATGTPYGIQNLLGYTKARVCLTTSGLSQASAKATWAGTLDI
jgi:hypothetical protein